MIFRSVIFSAVLCFAFAFPAGAQSFAPKGWADDLKLNELPDLNPDPAIVEIELVARLADVQVDGKTVGKLRVERTVPLAWLEEAEIGRDLGTSLIDDYKGPFVYPGEIARVDFDTRGDKLR